MLASYPVEDLLRAEAEVISMWMGPSEHLGPLIWALGDKGLEKYYRAFKVSAFGEAPRGADRGEIQKEHWVGNKL